MAEKRKIRFGCIADDFTGGSDAASYLSSGGLNTILCSGIPDENFEVPEQCEAVVIALKSRTEKAELAVRESLEGVRRLLSWGAEQIYFKYCSTFDSTDHGNIGPVTDAIMEEMNVSSTILCPALPDNGRTVNNGILYVDGIPLEKSSMRNHPLTPMRKSRISDLMSPQGRYECIEIHRNDLRNTRQTVEKIRMFSQGKRHYYIVPDYEDTADAEAIVNMFGDMKFLTGGSGILTALARHIKKGEAESIAFRKNTAKALIVAGSVSVATHKQTEWFQNHGGKSIRLSDDLLLSGAQTPQTLWEEVKKNGAQTVLVYSYASPEELAQKRNEEGRKLAAFIEQTLSGLACIACKNGYKRIISAGGETSGAVTQALGYRSFWIGPSIAPGVPILIPIEDPEVRLVLKSGNFGQEDFFGRALRLTEAGKNYETRDK